MQIQSKWDEMCDAYDGSTAIVEMRAWRSIVTSSPRVHFTAIWSISSGHSIFESPTISDFSSSHNFNDAHDKLSQKVSRATCCSAGFSSKHSCKL
jgi:hypothetical protein